MSIAIGDLVAQIEANLDPLTKSLDEAKRSMDRADKQMSSSMDRFSKSVKRSGEQVKSLGKDLNKFVTLPLAAVGAGAFKLGKDFEASLSRVTGLVGVARDQVDAWGEDIIKMAPRLGKAPKELADALFFVTSAGIRGAEAMQVLEMSAKASTAGLGETKVVADLVTSAMNAYGSENLSAAQATDILTAAVREGKAEAADLAGSMGQVLPIASEMGVGFDQVAAATAAMTKTGTEATIAGTQLRQIMASLLRPTSQAEDQLSAMGTSSSQLRKTIQQDGLLKALQDIRSATLEYGEEAMGRVFPNIRALMGVLDLMGKNADENAKTFEAVAKATGSLDRAFEAATDTVEFKWQKAVGNAQASLVSLGKTVGQSVAPVLDSFSEKMESVTSWFNNLDESQRQMIVRVGALVAALGPLLTVLGFMMTNVVPGLITVYGGLTKVLAGARAAMIALNTVIATNPIGALITVITAAAGAWYLFNRRTSEATEKISQLEQINIKATRAIAKEKAEVEKLAAVIESENSTREQKLAAIRKLQSINKDYFGDLDTEKIKVDQVRESIEKYTDSLLLKARATAIEEKLVDLEKQRLDQIIALQKGQEKNAKKMQDLQFSTDPAAGHQLEQMKNLTEISESLNDIEFEKYKSEKKSLTDLLAETEQQIRKGSKQTTETVETETEKQIQAVQKGIQQLSNAGLTEGLSISEPVIDIPDVGDMFGDSEGRTAFNKTIDDYNARLRQATLSGELFASSQQVLQEKINATKQAMMALGEQGLDANHPRMELMKQQLSQLQGQLDGVKQKTTDWQKIGENAAQSIGNSFMQMAEQGKVSTSEIIKQLAAQITGFVIKSIVASALPLPAKILAAAGAGVLAGTLINKIPAFAEGGVVSGPQLAMVGEYPGARSNPEVIAPLDKLQGMLEPRRQNERVLSARVSKGDLLFVLEEARSEHTKKFGDI